MVVKIVISILFAILLVILLASVCCLSVYLIYFRWRSCRYCKYTMKYKGLRGDESNRHYLFQCPKCGAWEQLPIEDLYKQFSKALHETPNIYEIWKSW